MKFKASTAILLAVLVMGAFVAYKMYKGAASIEQTIKGIFMYPLNLPGSIWNWAKGLFTGSSTPDKPSTTSGLSPAQDQIIQNAWLNGDVAAIPLPGGVNEYIPVTKMAAPEGYTVDPGTLAAQSLQNPVASVPTIASGM